MNKYNIGTFLYIFWLPILVLVFIFFKAFFD